MRRLCISHSELDLLRDLAARSDLFVHPADGDCYEVQVKGGKRLRVGTSAEVHRFLRDRPQRAMAGVR